MGVIHSLFLIFFKQFSTDTLGRAPQSTAAAFLASPPTDFITRADNILSPACMFWVNPV